MAAYGDGWCALHASRIFRPPPSGIQGSQRPTAHLILTYDCPGLTRAFFSSLLFIPMFLLYTESFKNTPLAKEGPVNAKAAPRRQCDVPSLPAQPSHPPASQEVRALTLQTRAFFFSG